MGFKGWSSFRRVFAKYRDIIISDLTYFNANVIKWLYRRKIQRQIPFISIKNDHQDRSNTASLFLHSELKAKEKRETVAILMLHGLSGHPVCMLPFTDIANQMDVGPVFSLHVTYDEKHPEIHRTLLKKSIDEIERVLDNAGLRLKGLVTVGHSLGAIESAHQAFVENDTRIMAVISIAGRLRVVPSPDKACSEWLITTVEKVYQGILDKPSLPLYQIVAGDDWNAPLEASAVRLDRDCCYVVDGAMHFNILFLKDTHTIFEEYLKRSVIISPSAVKKSLKTD